MKVQNERKSEETIYKVITVDRYIEIVDKEEKLEMQELIMKLKLENGQLKKKIQCKLIGDFTIFFFFAHFYGYFYSI